MGQKWVRKLVDDGLRLYRDQEPYEAVVKWKRAVAKATDGRDKFVALGYLAWAHCEWGKYRDMLHYSVQQIDVANETNSNEMRAEAYLNLARSNEKLCEYHKAISYCRHSLSQATKNPKTLGQVYLCLGNAYLGFSDFQKALENMHNALHLALKNEDRSLECNTYGSLGDFYILLRDYERALQYHLKGAEMVAKCGEDWSVKFHTLARLNLANPYRKLQRLNIALECTEDAMKLALQHCDRNTQSRCLCLFADIHRNRHDFERALPRYEASLNIAVEIGDKVGQIHASIGMAKNMEMTKQFRLALEYIHRALDLAECIGSKFLAMKCHLYLEQIHTTLGQLEQAWENNKLYKQCVEDLALSCGVCNEVISEKPESLESLQCSHLFHASCLEEYTAGDSRGCPDCRRSLVKPVFV